MSLKRMEIATGFLPPPARSPHAKRQSSGAVHRALLHVEVSEMAPKGLKGRGMHLVFVFAIDGMGPGQQYGGGVAAWE